jgi:acetoacetyl-CoA synthetase
MVPRPDSFGAEVVGWETYLDKGDGDVEFVRMGFNEPIWILFSSGTTGKPKAIVVSQLWSAEQALIAQHRQGGMLIDSLRESHIAGDLGRGDVYFYYTTP